MFQTCAGFAAASAPISVLPAMWTFLGIAFGFLVTPTILLQLLLGILFVGTIGTGTTFGHDIDSLVTLALFFWWSRKAYAILQSIFDYV